MTDQWLAGVVTYETDPPERRHADRRGADRRSGSDRRTVDLLRETGRLEHECRRGTERRSGQDRRQAVRRPARPPDVELPAEIFMPWQMG